MKDVRISVMRISTYPDLMARFENPIEHACDMTEGDVFIAAGKSRRASARAPGAAWKRLCGNLPQAAEISLTAG